MHLGNYSKAAADYQRALETAPSEADIERVKVLINQNRRHIAAAAEATAKHKQAMSKAFVVAETDDRVLEKMKREEERRKKEEVRDMKRKKLQRPKTLNVAVITIIVFCVALLLFIWIRKLFFVRLDDDAASTRSMKHFKEF